MTEDGEWHDFEDMLRELGKLVTPGRAMRRAERQRLAGGGPAERTKGSIERILQTGRRSVVRDFVRSPWFEIVPLGTPGFQGYADRKVRLVKVPIRMERDRKMREEGRLFEPEQMALELLDSQNPGELLRDLSKAQLQRLILALL